MFDRRLEVTGHSRRQPEALLVLLLYPVQLGVQPDERVLGVNAQRGDPHQPDQS